MRQDSASSLCRLAELPVRRIAVFHARMNDIVISLQDVSKCYKLYESPRDRLKEALNPFGRVRHRDFYALRNIGFCARRGEILGVVGRNGSGKSTLLRLIAGVIQASTGRIHTRGRIATLLDLGAGLNPEYTGIQNVWFSGLMQGYSRQAIKGWLDEIVAFAQIGEFIHQPLKTYSSGMRARLGFALAVHIDPDILLVDEVLAVGDEFFRRKCFDRIERLLHSGCTVVMVSHDVSAVNQFCSRGLLIDQGELLLDGPPKQATAQYQRLLFAGSAAEQVRAEIRAHAAVPAKTSIRTAGGNPAETLPADGFQPELASNTAVRFETPHARIAGIGLETVDGRPVNILDLDLSYRLVFDVRFLDDFREVFFSMAVKNVKGMNISSDETRYNRIRFQARRGQTVRVAWTFTCRMLARDYFVNVGVYHLDEQGETVLIGRVSDALLFRVRDEAKSGRQGLVHLDQNCQVTELPEAAEFRPIS